MKRDRMSDKLQTNKRRVAIDTHSPFANSPSGNWQNKCCNYFKAGTALSLWCF